MILLLAGTADGRVIAELLAREGHGVLASAASDYGGSLLEGIPGVRVRAGRLEPADMNALFETEGISAVVDATHPFAAQVSANAAEVAAEAKVAYIRFERKRSELPEERLVYRAKGFPEAADLAVELLVGGSACRMDRQGGEAAKVLAGGEQATVFLTTGSKCFDQMVPAFKGAGVKVAARILPDQSSLAAALSSGLSPAEIVAAQGPFSLDLNREMFRHWNARAVIAKDSGCQGGTLEKAKAALELGIPFVLVDRPPRLNGSRSADIKAVQDIQALIELVRENTPIDFTPKGKAAGDAKEGSRWRAATASTGGKPQRQDPQPSSELTP